MSVRYVSAFACGTLFGLGLVVSSMTSPAKVLGFLDIAGAWDPSLLLVLMSAVFVSLVGFRFAARFNRPFLESTFERPPKEQLDARLIGGAAIFGAGWGLAGYCPGPGFVALAGSVPSAAAFVAAFVVGSGAYRLIERRRTAASAPAFARAHSSPPSERLDLTRRGTQTP